MDAVRRNVSSLRAVKAESLRHAFVAHLAGERTAEAIHRRAQELTGVEELLAQLGPEDQPARAVELVAAETLLRDAVYGAAIDAAETAAELVHSCWRGERNAAELRGALDLAAELAARLEELEEVDGR